MTVKLNKGEQFCVMDPKTQAIYKGHILNISKSSYIVLLDGHRFSQEISKELMKTWNACKQITPGVIENQ